MRDVLTLSSPPGELVIACDSLGSIGEKEGDEIQVPLQVAARFTARVALAEILSAGAEPLAVVLTLSIEPYPFLEKATAGIREELAEIGKTNLPLLFSSEKNIKTSQTGLGITVVGKKVESLPPPSFPLSLYALGIPSCGPEVLHRQEHIADLKDVLYVRTFAHALLPVGSQGVLLEALNLARELKARLYLVPPFPYSLFRSCGPATVLLFGSQKEEKTFSRHPKPIWKIGTLLPL